ncbi:MAG: hypothetical protein V4556_08415 [Bacteroidota bacterium]
MKKYLLSLICCLLTTSTLLAQDARDAKWKKDSSEVNITLFEDNQDGTVYTGMYEILKGLQPSSFVGATYYKGINRPYSLRDGEGVKGYAFEVNMDQVFTLLQGRNGSSDFWQRSRVAFKYAPAFRMAADSSFPVIPTNQKVGLEFTYALWNNYTIRDSIKVNSLKYAKDINWVNKAEPFKVLHLLLNVMHYSNGQSPGVFYQTSPVKRNDYKKGDFSTNYLSLMGIYSVYTKENRLFSAGAGIRLDGGVGNTFSFTTEQEKRYGKQRLLGLLQFRTKPKAFGKLIPWIDLQSGRQYSLRNKISFRHRIETEYIISNLDSFDRAKKNRLGIHFYSEADFAKSRTAGLIFHFYYGRDYLNIRYDDIVVGGNIGISFNLMKYRPPRQKSSSFINAPARIEYNKATRKDELIK